MIVVYIVLAWFAISVLLVVGGSVVDWLIRKFEGGDDY